MDLDKCLCCLSRNPTLKVEVISSSSSSSLQIMGGTTWSTLISGLLLEAEEDKDDEKNEANGEDEGASGRVFTL